MQVPVKIAGWVFLILILSVAMVAAESKYVSEDFEITLRTGPGTDRKIIELIPSGREVEIVTPGDEWTEVQTPGGKQGWVLTRYLTNELPTALKLDHLQARYDKIQTEYNNLKEKASTMGEENQKLSQELNQTKTDLDQLTKAHETLKSESADFLKLKSQYEASAKELKEARSKAQTAESELNQLSGDQMNQGLLYGGGLLILGFIAGFILKRPKRRSPLM